MARPLTAQCQRCGTKITDLPAKGRIPRWCSPNCRQMAYLERKHGGTAKAAEVLPQSTEATEAIRALIRSELWDLLTKAGVVAGPMPPADTETAP